MHASFMCVCDLNSHHQEWLGSTITNRHGVAAFLIASRLCLVAIGWLSARPMHMVEWLGSTITNRHGVAAFPIATILCLLAIVW